MWHGVNYLYFLLSYGLPVGVFSSVLLIGFLSARKVLAGLNEDGKFAYNFRECFIRFCNSQGTDSQSYTYMMLNSDRMQRDMGVLGVYASFSPPGASYKISNYPVILNMIPEIRGLIDREQDRGFGLFASTIRSYINSVDESLLRYMGTIEEKKTLSLRTIRNPLSWFFSGIIQLLSFPFMFLVSFGLMTGSTLRTLQSSYIFKICGLLISIVSFLSGVVTIILGWDQVSLLIAPLLHSKGG